MIVVLVLVDILVMSLWFGVDTPRIVTTTLESQVSKVLRETRKCSSSLLYESLLADLSLTTITPVTQISDRSYRIGQGHPTSKKILEKGLECSFLLSHIVLWSFKGIFVRANTI